MGWGWRSCEDQASEGTRLFYSRKLRSTLNMINHGDYVRMDFASPARGHCKNTAQKHCTSWGLVIMTVESEERTTVAIFICRSQVYHTCYSGFAYMGRSLRYRSNCCKL